MSYRHQAHAANLSDIVKHLCLSSLRHWPRLETIWDAYAAAPATAYSQLGHRQGLLDALMMARGPQAVTEFQQVVAACRLPGGGPAYPGSSTLLAGFDAVRTLLLTDTQRRCIEDQKAWFANCPRPGVEATVLDSVRAADAVLDRLPDLVFIDPPFLEQQEWPRVLGLIGRLRQSVPDVRIVLWYPLRDGLELPAALEAMPGLRLQASYRPGQGLKGCGVMMLNFEAGLYETLAPLAAWLGGPGLPGIERVAWGD